MAKKKKVTKAQKAIADSMVKEETPAFSGETMVPEIPAEAGTDHLPTEKEELLLKDEVLVQKEDLPSVDKIEFEAPAEESYDEGAEVNPSPVATNKQWVADPALLKKVEGYRDTLNGTLYLGTLK